MKEADFLYKMSGDKLPVAWSKEKSADNDMFKKMLDDKEESDSAER